MDKKLEEMEVVEVAEEEVVSESRRKFVQAAGKIAVYTPPAMLVLMNPSVKAFAQSAGGGGDRPRRRRRNRNRRRRGG